MDYRRGECELRLWGYFRDPAKMELKDLKHYDDSAQRFIKECEATIEQLRKYRLELAERANELLTMKTHHKVSLIREKRWKGAVIYYLNHELIYDDGTTETVETVKYTGKERHKAIKAFKESQKKYPQYEYHEDIAKGKWE